MQHAYDFAVAKLGHESPRCAARNLDWRQHEMKISLAEQQAIRTVINSGRCHGFGNMISHLQTAWAAELVNQGLNEKTARQHTGADYPFAMQTDLVERGEWDETGESYRSKQ